LPIDSIFGTIEDFSAPGSQLVRERVNPYDPKVDVGRTFGRAAPNFGLIPTAEKHLNLVTPHNGKNRSGICSKANPLSIPITRDLETENVSVVLGRPHQVRDRELGHRCHEANSRWYLAHRELPQMYRKPSSLRMSGFSTVVKQSAD
jgi:hypothetical protein